MSTRLIINSDDYGRTPEVSRGIRDSHLHGVVTSTTCMMNIPTTSADIAIALQEAPRLGLGVHLVLTADRPIIPRERIKSISDEQGNFLKLPVLISRLQEIDVDEVRIEWRAQIEAFVKAAGRKPTHLDSHHHSSYFSPDLFRAMLEFAKEFQCGIRLPFAYGSDDMAGLPLEVMGPIRTYAPKLLAEFDPPRPDAFLADFYDEQATRADLLRMINEMPEGTFEIMCHPGHVDDGLRAITSYAEQRKVEFDVLTDPSVKEAIQARKIELISFAQL
jgi:chitin disaccharide deacetylase